MNLRWTASILLVICLISCPVECQKRRKGDKKKEAETVTVAAKPEGGGKRGRQTTTTTTTTTSTTTPTTTTTILIEEDIDEEIRIVNEPRTAQNVCPPELKSQNGETLPCTCRDELDDNALMVECVALTSAQQMHTIFNVIRSAKQPKLKHIRQLVSCLFCFGMKEFLIRKTDRCPRSPQFDSRTIGEPSNGPGLHRNYIHERQSNHRAHL